jgi:hypothetical protein
MTGVGRSTVLMLGDSFDRRAMNDFCGRMGGESGSDKVVGEMWGFSGVCQVGDFTIAFFVNQGTGEPPYWKCSRPHCNHKRPLPPYLHEHSEDRIKYDAVEFSQRVFGTKNPTVVLVHTALWDLANQWERAGFPGTTNVDEAYLTRWCQHDMPHMFRWVSDAFASSRIILRTMPTMRRKEPIAGAEGGRSPEVFSKMTTCLRNISRNRAMIDYRGIVERLMQMGMPADLLFAKDGVHPSQLCAPAGYMTSLLDIVRQSAGDPGRMDRKLGFGSFAIGSSGLDEWDATDEWINFA